MLVLSESELIKISAGESLNNTSTTAVWYCGYIAGAISWYFIVPGTTLPLAFISNLINK